MADNDNSFESATTASLIDETRKWTEADAIAMPLNLRRLALQLAAELEQSDDAGARLIGERRKHDTARTAAEAKLGRLVAAVEAVMNQPSMSDEARRALSDALRETAKAGQS